MTYFPSVPQPPEKHSESQPDFLANFGQLNTASAVDHIPFGNSIESATAANPCVITSTDHGLQDGNSVTIYNLQGLLDGVIIPWTINGTSFTVANRTDNTFALSGAGSDTSLQNPYIANTGHWDSGNINYMRHKKVTFADPLGIFPRVDPAPNFPNLPATVASLFTMALQKTVNDELVSFSELFYQNDNSSSAVEQLTNNNISYTLNSLPGFALWTFNSPWGLTFNVGVAFIVSTTPATITFPTSYAAGTHYTTVATIKLVSASTGEITEDRARSLKITNLTDNSFDIESTPSSLTSAYFLSVGKTA